MIYQSLQLFVNSMIKSGKTKEQVAKIIINRKTKIKNNRQRMFMLRHLYRMKT